MEYFIKKIAKLTIHICALLVPVSIGLIVITGEWAEFITLQFWLYIAFISTPVIIYLLYIYTPYRYIPVLKKYCDKQGLVKLIQGDKVNSKKTKNQVVIGDNWLVVRRRYINLNLLAAYNINSLRPNPSATSGYSTFTFIYKTGEIFKVYDCKYIGNDLEDELKTIFMYRQIKNYQTKLSKKDVENFALTCRVMTKEQAENFFASHLAILGN